MIQYFIDIILVRFPDPLVQSESGNLTIKPSPYLAGPSLHFTLLSCLLSIVLIFICPVSSPTPFCPISLFDFPYRAFWFVLSQLFHPFSSAGPWPIFSGRSPLLKSRSRSGHLSVFSAFKRRWWREWRQSKVDHGAITVKEELVWWNTGDVSFCWTKWHHINQMLPKKMKGILEETTTRLNWGHLPSSNTTSTICLKILHSTIHGKGTMSHMILMLGKLEKTQLKGRLLAEAKPSRCPFPEGWGDQIIDQRGSPPSQRMVTTVHCLKPDDAVKSYFTHRSKQTLMLRWENVLCVLRFLICYIWHILR